MIIDDKEYLSVKEFAETLNVSQQYIYRLMGKSLKPYVKKHDKKRYIEAAAIEFIKNGFPSIQQSSTNSTQQVEKEVPSNNDEKISTNLTDVNSTNSTNSTNSEAIAALNKLIDELKADKEDLKRDKEQLIKDKEDLKQEAFKWQQLLLDEKNKVKMLEAAANKDSSIDQEVYKDIEPTNTAVEPEEKNVPPQTFFEKLKWLFK